jgi:hypothetical protein
MDATLDWHDEESYLPGSDLVADHMLKLGLPLTRQAWLDFNYPDGVPEPLPGKIAASIPRGLRDEREALH